MAVLMLTTPVVFAQPPHLDIQSASASSGSPFSSYQIELAAPFMSGLPGLYGVGAAGINGKFLVVTTHAGVTDSEAQPPPEAPHTHLAEVEGVDNTICASGIAVKSVSFEEVGILTLIGSEVHVTNIPSSEMGGGLTGSFLSFTLSGGAGGRICINPEDSFVAAIVGGQILPLDMATLFIVGASSSATWILPTLVGVVGAAVLTAIGFRKRKTSK